jgi:hypothetical protein
MSLNSYQSIDQSWNRPVHQAKNAHAVVSMCMLAGVLGLVMATSGCTPPELLEAPGGDTSVSETGVTEEDSGPGADGSADTNPNTDTSTDAGETGGGGEPTFGEVAEIMRGSCASTPTCHGGSGFTNFSIEAGAMATDAEVRTSLEGVAALSGTELIVPGDAESSAIYSRLRATGVQMMPPAGQPELIEAEIELVRAWIDQGANYE